MSQDQKLTTKQNVWQVIKFTLFSISAGVIQIGVFALLHDAFGIEQWAFSYLPSLILSVLWNFTFNRRYTFKSAANVPKAMLLVALYYVAFTPLSTWWGTALENAGWHDWLVQGFTMIINFVTEFLWQRFVVFRNKINTNDIAQREKETEERE